MINILPNEMWILIFDKLPNLNLFYCSKQLYVLRLKYSVYKYPILRNDPPMIYDKYYHIFWKDNYLRVNEIPYFDWNPSHECAVLWDPSDEYGVWWNKEKDIIAMYPGFVFYKKSCQASQFGKVRYNDFNEILLIKCYPDLCFIYLKNKLIVISDKKRIFE